MPAYAAAPRPGATAANISNTAAPSSPIKVMTDDDNMVLAAPPLSNPDMDLDLNSGPDRSYSDGGREASACLHRAASDEEPVAKRQRLLSAPDPAPDLDPGRNLKDKEQAGYHATSAATTGGPMIAGEPLLPLLGFGLEGPSVMQRLVTPGLSGGLESHVASVRERPVASAPLMAAVQASAADGLIRQEPPTDPEQDPLGPSAAAAIVAGNDGSGTAFAPPLLGSDDGGAASPKAVAAVGGASGAAIGSALGGRGNGDGGGGGRSALGGLFTSLGDDDESDGGG